MIIRDSALLFEQPGMLPEKVLSNLVEQASGVDMEKVRQETGKGQAPSPAVTQFCG
jgi:hypothetical protein